MSARLAALLHRPDRLARQAASFVSYLYVAISILLGVWLAVISLTTGWRPVVITGGSMQPALRVGDVLLVDDHPTELLGQRTVITFEPTRGPGPVTHRIHEVLPESQTYITKGDANDAPDTDAVTPAQVIGVGRLVIPAIGLPLIWQQTGDWVTLGALAVLSVGALGVALSGVLRRSPTNRSSVGRTSEMANRGIRSVRFLAGLIILGSLYFQGEGFQVDQLGLRHGQVVVGAVLLLVLVNVGSLLVSRRRGSQTAEWLVTVELGADTVLAGALIALTGGSGISWAFIALPIVEAAVRFRLVGALLHWVVMTMVTVGARLFSLDRSGAPLYEVVGELEQLLDQLGILLLLIVPGAYLTEQLVTDVLRQDRATSMAVERAHLLERVAETGYELNRLGSNLFATMTTAITTLGFDVGDALLRLGDGQWKLLSTSHPDLDRTLPQAGDAGSGLRPQDLDIGEVLIDRNDPELSEVVALRSHDLDVLARLTISTEEGRYVVVRAARSAGSPAPAGAIDALRLLAGQASVAMQNDQLVSELQDVQVELAHQALHDALTHLPNRAQFMERLQDGLVNATDPRLRHAVMFMDLNGFKGINDTLGHEAGDSLLIGVAGRLVAAVGDDGMVARLGGDEFTVLLDPVPDIDAALKVAKRIHAIFVDPFQLGDTAVNVSGSIGIALAEIGLGGSEILRRADVAMYAAKSSPSTPRTRVYEVDLDGQDHRRGRLSAEFVKALEAGQFEIVYQPLVSPSGEVRGVEALLRWTHRELGPVSPATILELAEATARVDELTAFVIGTALSSVANCGIRPDVDFTLAVNVTPVELASPYLAEIIQRGLTASGFRPDQLVVELNERVVADGRASRDNLDRVMALGVGLSLDDFGEGQTSLGHLRGLPISQLKLDRSLVQQAATSEADNIILKSVIGLAHDLNFEVVTEGVETVGHLEAAVGAGADLLQGFGLYRPMRLVSLRKLLSDRGLLVGTGAAMLATTAIPTSTTPLPRRTSKRPDRLERLDRRVPPGRGGAR